MIEFTKKDEGKEYISILVGDGTPTEKIYKRIIDIYPNLKKSLYKKDDTEILFEFPESSNEEKRFNCSYQDLVITVKEVTPFAETRMIKIENGIRINIFDIPHLN